jgi:hypothetical protein
MKANHEISSSLLANESDPVFKNEFFSRFELRKAPHSLRLTDQVEKHYQFPTFYGNVTCGIGIFHCDYEKARRLLPSSRIKPVRMPRGRALVTFSCYEYRNVMNVAPYHEIAMTIPVLLESAMDLPVLPVLLGSRYPGFGYYVFGMPVTSKENQIRGNQIWGLPKITQDIETFEEKINGQDHFVTEAFETSGEKYFSLRIPMQGKPQRFDVSADLFSFLDQRMLVSQTAFDSIFQVVKNPALLFKRAGTASADVAVSSAATGGKSPLWIGTTESARTLRELDIESEAFQFRFTRGMSAAFDLPRKEYTL